MCLRLPSIDISLHDTVLVDTNGCENIEGTLVAGIDTIEYQANDDFLPCWTAFVPEFRLLQVHDLTNVLHYTVQCAGGEHLVFVIVGNGNEQLSMSVVHSWT